MKFACICIGGLNSAMLVQLRFAALDGMAYREIASTIPPTPITAWTSAWTGLDPAEHGKAPGIPGRKKDATSFWDEMRQQGISVETYFNTNIDGDVEADIAFFRLDDLTDLLLAGDLITAQEEMAKVDLLLEQLQDIPVVIISAYGINKHFTAFNVDKFLMMRGLFRLNGRDQIKYDATTAYPINYNGKKPRPTYGINVNSEMRKDGFLGVAVTRDITGQLLMQLNEVDNITAQAAHQVYDISGRYFPYFPDIVLSSRLGRTCFRSAGGMDQAIFSQYGEYSLSSMGLIASKPASIIEGVDHVVMVKKALSRAMQIARSGHE